MKTITNILGLIFTSFVLSCTNSIDYIDVKLLPRPDCTGKTSIWNEFDKNPIKVLVIPDSPSDLTEFNKMFRFKKVQYHDTLIRRESELIPDDFLKGLDIYGNINDFKNWERFEVPIEKIEYGYKFKNHEYKNKFDGIFYITDKRQVFTGNSMKIIWELQTTMTGYYKSIIFENGLLSSYCLPNDTIIDIDRVREANFITKSSKHFNLFVDKRFPNTTSINDSVVIDICRRLNLKLPDFKINAFLHDDANSTRLFTNYFFMGLCDTLEKDFKINAPAMNGIHTNGLDIETIKHETFHLLWDNTIGSPGNQSFLCEGIQEYYQQLLDPSRIKHNIEVLKRHSDYKIDTLILRGNGNDFWGGGYENNWPIAYNISGLFVKYLIDNWGLDTFKRFYTMIDRENAYKEIYDLTPVELEKQFYSWIKKITPHNTQYSK